MLFSRVVAFFSLSMSMGALTLAKPLAGKPDLAAVNNVVTNLKSSTEFILPEIRDLVENDNVTDTTIAPLMNELIGAINNAQTSLAKVPHVPQSMLENSQNVSEIASLLAEIIADITTVLDGLLGTAAGVPILGALIPELDAALTALVTSLGTLVTGLLATVSGLLSTVSVLLSSVGLGLLAGILGLGLGGL